MGIKERKEREKEARREEIISAAEKVFFEKGLVAATMDEIAERAELSKGTIYLYYKSKEDLYIAAALRGWDLLARMFEEATSTGEPPLKLIENLGNAYYAYFLQHRDYYRMAYLYEHREMHTLISGEMVDQCNLSNKRIWGCVCAPIQMAQEEGLIRDDIKPMEASVMLWANCDGLMRLIDQDEKVWLEEMGIHLESLLRKSNRLLVEGMLTEKGKKQMAGLFELTPTATQ